MSEVPDPVTDPENPIVFFDIAVGDRPIGRIKLELYRNVCPKTVENFRQLCTGEFIDDKKPVGFKGCTFHRVIKNALIQGGDFINVCIFDHPLTNIQGDGTGSISIYGNYFDDENFRLKHNAPGLLSMANSGPNRNGCQFIITCSVLPSLDGKHVVFGHVVEGMKIVRMIENVSVDANCVPKFPCRIIQCGQM